MNATDTFNGGGGNGVALPLPLYILAGGRSSRFGSDKARAEFHGRPMILSVAQALAPIASTTTAIADVRDKYADLGLPTLADATPHLGPLGGIVAALADRRRRLGTGWLVLAACDLVGPDPNWVRGLASAAQQGHHAVLFHAQRDEPMLALYHTDLWDAAQRALAEGRTAVWRLLASTPAVRLPLPEGLTSLPQANTPAELHDGRCPDGS